MQLNLATIDSTIMVMYYCQMTLLFSTQPHQDGPAYFPVVAILSLGSPVVMDFTPHSRLILDTNDAEDTNSSDNSFEIENKKWLDGHHPLSILLMPRSLLIFKDELYTGGFLFSLFALQN